MKKNLVFFMGVLMCISVYSQSQLKVFQDWQSNTGSQNFLFKNRTKTDASNNVYVVGATMNATNYDILVAKYNQNGVLQWINQYNGAGNANDLGTGVTIDASGNVYVTGTSCTSALPTSADLIVIKYNSSGVQQWIQTYNGTGSNYDSGADIFQMTGTNVGIYVTGSSYNASGNTDYITLKYSTAGVQQWVSRYNHTSNLNDAAVRIGVNATGVTIIGAVETATTTYSCATVTYNAITGAQTGVTTTAGGTSTITEVNDMVIDASNNIYITGTGVVAGQGNNYFTIKLNSLLVQQWQQTYNGASNLNDISKGIQVDGSGNVFVTGYSTITGQGRNMVTIKYNSSGTQQWAQTYNNPLNTDDEAYGIALDNSGNAYVTGYNQSVLNQKDFYTIKYNTSGTSQWEIATDGDKHLNDEATNIVIDDAGAIIVAGQSETASGVFEYLTVKYIEKNITTPTDYNSEVTSPNYGYYKNAGQLVNTSNAAISSVKYYTNFTSPKYYINNNSFSFVYTHAHSLASLSDTTHRVDVTFTQCNASAKVYPIEEQSDYLNYFLAHCANGITEIHGNNRLVVPNLYPNIDLMYCSNQNGIKYYYIINPGATPTNIEMIYTGASSTAVNGTTHYLNVNTSIGNLVFDRPTVYQLSTANVIIPITTWYADFVSSGTNSYKFNVGAYDNTKIMIIEVDQGNGANVLHINSPEWSMYFGGSGYDEGTGVTNDIDGNPYFTGFTSSANFPTSTGVQTASGGGFDAFVGKFGSANGASSSVVPTSDKKLWCTYYGGTSDDRAYAVSTTGNGTSGSVFITGHTTIGGLITFPQAGAYNQSTNAGGKDAFVLKLDNAFGGITPSSVWSTNFGGYRDDVAKTIKNDGAGNFYIGGSTASNFYTTSTTCTIPTDTYFPKCNTGSSFNNGGGYGGGTSDGFIAKFTNSGQILWSSFYGGTDVDTINGISIDGSDIVYLTGKTASTTGFPLTTLSGGYNQTTFGGGTFDAFIGKFNSSGTHQWSTYFGGSGDDGGSAVVAQSSTNIYFSGETSSSTPACTTCTCTVPTTGQFPLCPLTGAYFQGTASTGVFGGGTSDGFITKFNNAGIYKWGTYYGGGGKDIVNSLALDYLNQLFFAGKTYSTASANIYYISGTIPAWFYAQTALLGTCDGFLGEFDGSNARYWASYAGGSGLDLNNGISVYSTSPTNKFWYTTGSTNSTDYNTMAFSSSGNCCPNAYTQWTNAGGTDATVLRYSNTGMYMVGIEDISNTFGLDALVYPNPATYNVTLNVTLKERESLTINVYSITGQLLFTENMGKQEGEIIKQIDFSNFANGIYVLQVKTDTKMISKKIIKHD